MEDEPQNPFLFLYQNFLSVMGVARLIFIELVALFCLSGVLANIAQDLAGQGGEFSGGTVVFYLVAAGLGLACAASVLHEILNPMAGPVTARGLLHVGRVTMINVADSKIPYYFLSTHPSYVFIDAFNLGVVLIVFAVRLIAEFEFDGMGVFEWVSSASALVLMLALPLFRLFSWYGLGRKLPRELTRGAWIPVLLYYLLVSVPVTAGLWLAREDVIALFR